VTNIIFCSDPLNRNKVDPSWEMEYLIAKQKNLKIHLLDFEQLASSQHLAQAFKKVIKPESSEKAVYRGWMMPVGMYEDFYHTLLQYNLELINTPTEYKHCFYFPESYELIKPYTPQSFFMKGNPLQAMEELKTILHTFGDKPIMVKDYVKSQKHYWHEACFIPKASDTEHALKVIKKFVELQGDNFQGGLVLREFVELEPLGKHSKSDMPLTKEYRIFILNGQRIALNNYWDEKVYSEEEIPWQHFEQLYKDVKSHLYTMDIAKQKNGNWIIIELGDAQVAEYIGEQGLDDFYDHLST